MTLDPVLYRRVQERSDRFERQARLLGAAPHRFTWQPPPRHEPIRLQPLGEPCPNHPGEVIGTYGCPACNAGKRWLERGQVAQVGAGSRP